MDSSVVATRYWHRTGDGRVQCECDVCPRACRLDRPPTPPKTLARARRIALDNGIRYAYTGNVHDTSGQAPTATGAESLSSSATGTS